MSKLILFDGYLAQMYPEGIRVEARSPAEAISALQLYPGFREEDEVQHRVTLPDFQSHDAIFLPTDKEIIEVVPILEGAGGKAGVLQIVIGVVLIAAGFVTGGGTWAGLFTGAGLSTGGNMAFAGAMMVLGGAMQMMMPQPSMGENSNDEKSNYLAANKNTVAIGTPIPLIFGTRRVWPHLLSYNVTATNLQEPAPVAPVPQTASVVVNSEYEIDYTNWNAHLVETGGA